MNPSADSMDIYKSLPYFRQDVLRQASSLNPSDCGPLNMVWPPYYHWNHLRRKKKPKDQLSAEKVFKGATQLPPPTKQELIDW